jgi:Domain of Unknown Function (DUF1259)
MTALHSHMLDDQPRLYFMHFWANDDQNFDVVGFGLPTNQPDRDVSAP